MRQRKSSGLPRRRSPIRGARCVRRSCLASVLASLGASLLLGVLSVLCSPAPTTAAATPDCTWHTVVSGDTLGNLGWTYHTTALALARLNHIPDPNLIYIGQRLCIPRHSAQAEGAPQCLWHTVVAGDTLGKLGRATGNSVSALARANHISNPDLIYVGQQLCLSVPGSRAAPLAPGGAVASAGKSVAAGATAPAAPATAPAPPALSGGSATGAQAFIQFVLPYAREAHVATGWPTSLILAQWGLEQGWHVPSYTGYNFGNCGAIPGVPLVPGLNVPGSPAAFAYAPTPQDGVRIYVYVAHLPFYAAVAPAAASGGPDAAARALGESPWDAAHYTAIGEPGSSLLSILHTFNLYWYDTH